MARYALRDRIQRLDPDVDYEEINRILVTQEFPWDINQALSFALLRTYAVPSIGSLLADTGEFTERVQKRYDDTALILDAILEYGFSSVPGRDSIRRMNQMHGSYDISNDDMLYVLSTFVVTPVRWIDSYGWRTFTQNEIAGSTNYYRELGRFMGIKGIPSDYAAFELLMDNYEREHFGYDAGGKAVADSTLEIFCTFPPNNFAPAVAVKRFARSIMDAPLLDAFGYPHTTRIERTLSTIALRARAHLVRHMRPRNKPKFAREMPNIRSYPNGYAVSELGTFPRTCPVKHPSALEPSQARGTDKETSNR